MKTELTVVNETRKSVRVELPAAVVDAEIDRAARDYARKARIPGFRPGKVPASVVKTRFRHEILHEVANELIPRALENALTGHGLEAVDTPDVRDVVIDMGQPLTFTAAFDTLPAFDPGDFAGITLPAHSAEVTDEALGNALQRLRERAARYEPVEGRGVMDGDTVVADLSRKDQAGATDTHPDVNLEMGGPTNPPGFDAHVLGLEPGATTVFPVPYPADYQIAELAGTEVEYTVAVKGIKRKVLPELDDEFAKDLGEFESLDALKSRVKEDLAHEARHAAERDTRGALLKQLATRLPFEVPTALVERELDRRLEDFARRLMEQNIDPRQAGVDWNAFRQSQAEVAKEAVASSLVLDEVARRESLDATEDDIEREVARYAERTGRTAAAVRAQLEKEGGLSRVAAGLRREKSIEFVTARATMAGA